MPGKSILIVEPYNGVRETLVCFFEGEGYEVSTAFSGENALDMVADCPVDVVISAVMGLPGMTGVEFAERVREQNPEIVIFLMSGGMPPLIRIRAGTVARKVFNKPFDLSDLLVSVASAC